MIRSRRAAAARRVALACGLLVVWSLSSPLAAAEETRGEQAGTETEVTVAMGSQVSLLLGFGGPLGATGGLELLHGLGADLEETAPASRTDARARLGLVLQLHGGSGGGKVGLGLGARARVRERSPHDHVDVHAGAALKLVFARTWGSPRGTLPDVSYAGLDLDIDVMSLMVSVGPLFRVGGAPGDGAMFAWSVGLRL